MFMLALLYLSMLIECIKHFVQSGGQLENGEKMANKLMKLIRIAIKMPTADDKPANFKRITGN